MLALRQIYTSNVNCRPKNSLKRCFILTYFDSTNRFKVAYIKKSEKPLKKNGNYTCVLPGMQSDHIVSNFFVIHFLVEQRSTTFYVLW